MKNLLLMSLHPGAGVNTIAANLAIGLARLDYHVLLGSTQPYSTLADWLEGSQHTRPGLLLNYPRLIWAKQVAASEITTRTTEPYDYSLYIIAKNEVVIETWIDDASRVVCVVNVEEDNTMGVIALDQEIRQQSGNVRGVDLVVLNKVLPGEWEKSSGMMLDLGQHLGWEKVADPIPFCEAIHDLPRQNQSVWELPSQYSNRKEAFQRLVETVVGLR